MLLFIFSYFLLNSSTTTSSTVLTIKWCLKFNWNWNLFVCTFSSSIASNRGIRLEITSIIKIRKSIILRDKVFILTCLQEPKGTKVTEVQLVFYEISQLLKKRIWYASAEILVSFSIKKFQRTIYSLKILNFLLYLGPNTHVLIIKANTSLSALCFYPFIISCFWK